MTYIPNLIDALKKETEVYEQLLQIAREKKQVIIDNDVKKLESITKKEKTYVLALVRLEEIRDKIIKHLQDELNIEVVEKLDDIINALDTKWSTRAIIEKKKLISLVSEMKKENQENQQLIEQSLDYINFNLSMLTEDSQVDNYTGAAQSDQSKKQKTNLFDVKV